MLASSKSMDSSILNYWDMELMSALCQSQFVDFSLDQEVNRRVQSYNELYAFLAPDRFKTETLTERSRWELQRLPETDFSALHPRVKRY